jgi:hypothetical protein
MLERRTFPNGFGALLFAPAIVRVENIMPVRALPPELLAPTKELVWWTEPPPLSATLQTWENYLAALKTAPDELGKEYVIERAERGIEIKRRRGDR